MTHKLIFDSAKSISGELFDLACGHISLNEISFLNEKIMVNIESRTGEIEFFGADSNKLLFTKIPTPSSGDEKFSEVMCIVEGDYIKLGFPQYVYKDNYPNCDGEHDRWEKSISGYDYLCFDYKNNCIVE